MGLYGILYRNALGPLYERARGRRTDLLYHQARLAERQTVNQLRVEQWQELQQLLLHADKHCDWHRRRLAQLQLRPEDIRTPADFLKLPPIGKSEIRAHRNEMVADNFKGQLYKECTGGSTGVPMQYFYDRASYEWRLAVSMRGYAWAGCEDGNRQFYLWGEPIGTPPWKARVKTGLHNYLLSRRIFSSFRLNEETMRECIAEINAYRPVTIIGYTNALFLAAQQIVKEGGLRHFPTGIITAAEGVNSMQREIIEQAFKAPVFASYGSREFMLIAMECEQHHGLHLSADNLLVEVLVGDRPAQEGEPGEIVVTDLHNYGMPLIRYKIGDVGVLTTRSCACGRGLPLLERVEGRVLDTIRTPEGRIVPGEFFPHLMKEFDSVIQFQVIQKQLDLLEIKLVLRNGNPVPRIEQEVKRMLGGQIMVDIQTVPEIPVGTNGKFRVTMSELPVTADNPALSQLDHPPGDPS